MKDNALRRVLDALVGAILLTVGFCVLAYLLVGLASEFGWLVLLPVVIVGVLTILLYRYAVI